MKIGITELLLIICIATVAVGPQVIKFVGRWSRRAKRGYARAERRRAVAAVQRRAELEIVLRRLHWFGMFLLVGIIAVLVWTFARNYFISTQI